MQTRYEFVLPRGYVDEAGVVHRRGTMRLATARDELEPLRDPTISGPDDPRLTILVLTRVVETLGDMVLVTPHEIEGLFAADLAYLQDFYGVINFGSEEDIAALLAAQAEQGGSGGERSSAPVPVTDAVPAPAVPETGASGTGSGGAAAGATGAENAARPGGRRAAIEEVPSPGR